MGFSAEELLKVIKSESFTQNYTNGLFLQQCQVPAIAWSELSKVMGISFAEAQKKYYIGILPEGEELRSWADKKRDLQRNCIIEEAKQSALDSGNPSCLAVSDGHHWINIVLWPVKNDKGDKTKFNLIYQNSIVDVDLANAGKESIKYLAQYLKKLGHDVNIEDWSFNQQVDSNCGLVVSKNIASIGIIKEVGKELENMFGYMPVALRDIFKNIAYNPNSIINPSAFNLKVGKQAFNDLLTIEDPNKPTSREPRIDAKSFAKTVQIKIDEEFAKRLQEDEHKIYRKNNPNERRSWQELYKSSEENYKSSMCSKYAR